VTLSRDNTIYLWDGWGAPIGGPFTLLTDDSNLDENLERVVDVEVSADGTHIFCLISNSMAPSSFRILDTKTGADSTHLYTTPNPGQSVIRGLESSENRSKIICIFEDGIAHIVDSGTLIKVTLGGHIESNGSVVFMPDAT
jgi:WD40 repeat protein